MTSFASISGLDGGHQRTLLLFLDKGTIKILISCQAVVMFDFFSFFLFSLNGGGFQVWTVLLLHIVILDEKKHMF